MNRVEILQEASKLIGSDRPSKYGEVGENYDCTAELWEVYDRYVRRNKGTRRPQSHDAIMKMVLMKVARVATGEYVEDNYIDGAGYFANAGEVGARWLASIQLSAPSPSESED